MGRVLLLVASPRSRRRSARTWAPEEPRGDGLPWPMLHEQQALRVRLGGSEQAAAASRAQVLVSQGYGPLLEWLQHPGQHPGERPPAAQAGGPAGCPGHEMQGLFEAA